MKNYHEYHKSTNTTNEGKENAEKRRYNGIDSDKIRVNLRPILLRLLVSFVF